MLPVGKAAARHSDAGYASQTSAVDAAAELVMIAATPITNTVMETDVGIFHFPVVVLDIVTLLTARCLAAIDSREIVAIEESNDRARTEGVLRNFGSRLML